MGILQNLRASSDHFFNRVGTRLYDVRYGSNLVISPRPLVKDLNVQATSEFNSELSPSESLETWEVSITRTTLLRQFGSEAAFLSAVQGNQLWYIRRERAVGWVPCRSFGKADADAADSYMIVLKALGFQDPTPQ